MDLKTINHLNPVWREKSNFIIGAICTGTDRKATTAWEQLWSKRISDNIFEICCIPFFLYDLSLGDEVKTDKDYWVVEVTKRSGHFTFRVWFGDSTSLNIRDVVIQQVNDLGCLCEWYSDNLLAIDAPSVNLAVRLSGFLYEKQQLGLLTYETGQT